jgi:hypothetical protein
MMRGVVAIRNCFVNASENVRQGYLCLGRNLAWGTPEHNIIDIATWYELDGLGFEFQWGRDFPHPSRSALVPTQSAVERVLSPLWGGKSVEGRIFTTPI